MEIGEFLQAVTEWATMQGDIRGVALVGSRARGAATPESDVDLVILCRHPADLLRADDWTRQFGDIDTSSREQYGVMTSIRVLYKGGVEAEFGIADRSWASVPLDSGTTNVISGGMRILHDPDGVLAVALDATDTGR